MLDVDLRSTVKMEYAKEMKYKRMEVFKMEDIFKEALTGEVLENALNFVKFLNANEIVLAKQHELHYKGERVCYIDTFKDSNTWSVWTEGDYSNECENFPIDKRTKEIAWKHAAKCGNCEGTDCSPGITKIIFGKAFANICNGAHVDMRFENPDAETLEGLKKLLDEKIYYG